MTTAKQIEAMDYGTPAQMAAADAWYLHFVAFAERHPLLAECVWQRLHNHEVWYLARSRWMAGFGYDG